ncbi:MAG: Mur ligase, partial [Ardenticatenales bacterium]
MDIHDSRRLTGPNLLLPTPGACLDVALDALGDPSPADAAAAWERVVARLLAAVGWGGAATATRAFDAGVSLAFAAPVDGLYA